MISSTRIKPNLGEKLQERSSTSDTDIPTKSVSSGNAGFLRSNLPIGAGEERNAPSSNERDEGGLKEAKAAPKKWSAASNTPEISFPRLTQVGRSYIANYEKLPPTSWRATYVQFLCTVAKDLSANLSLLVILILVILRCQPLHLCRKRIQWYVLGNT